MANDLIRGYYTFINGRLTWVRVYDTPRHRDPSLGMTKPKSQRNRGREAGGRFCAKERE